MSKGPLRPPRVRRHLSHDARFVHSHGLAKYGLGPCFNNLLCQRRVKAHTDMKVIAVRKLKFAVGGLPNRECSVRAFAGVFNEVKKTDDRNYVSLAQTSESGRELSMVTTAQPAWNLTFKRLEIFPIQQRHRRRGWHGGLVLQKIQVRVVFVGRFGATGWELIVTRLGIQRSRIAACYGLLLSSLFGEVVGTVGIEIGRNGEQETAQQDCIRGLVHGSSMGCRHRWALELAHLPLNRWPFAILCITQLAMRQSKFTAPRSKVKPSDGSRSRLEGMQTGAGSLLAPGLRPSLSASDALSRCIWIFQALTQTLFPSSPRPPCGLSLFMLFNCSGSNRVGDVNGQFPGERVARIAFRTQHPSSARDRHIAR